MTVRLGPGRSCLLTLQFPALAGVPRPKGCCLLASFGVVGFTASITACSLFFFLPDDMILAKSSSCRYRDAVSWPGLLATANHSVRSLRTSSALLGPSPQASVSSCRGPYTPFPNGPRLPLSSLPGADKTGFSVVLGVWTWTTCPSLI